MANKDKNDKLSPTISPPQWEIEYKQALAKRRPTEEEMEAEMRVARANLDRIHKTPEYIALLKAKLEFRKRSAVRKKNFETELLQELKGSTNPTQNELYAVLLRMKERMESEPK